MAILNVGDDAPSFELDTDAGERVSSRALQGKPIVLFFYPKDDTPGCTIECKEFRDAKASFEQRAFVFGISPDDVASHQAFRDKYALNFPLLSDPGHQVAEAFGVWAERKPGSFGILRTTFIIDQGKVIRVFEGVKPEGHAAEVLAALP
ncbi:MAG: peroxiredoxin [Myxococcales bacterium]|nr:MAG: peroxiredoxin [Myxococcales bacterium]